ncbi:teichoic acid glycerol-phosphate primase TarB [Staphylococcus americanisciuri]|uniref:CDP-glycerol glycerophosphotransferase family protein n=1 Tax=Staphylococcus americanisciuri TaxID=2973940 RepID=A0ABT2F245_9STAP|nr:teichoic acid glycerol-phosphate primase TarB [Staphylococcus americanisciuri]MCS4486487.1 CDP-glycerol glycerophosphotransferase family protein [Staphylococcus americanisciuri]
MMRLIIKEFYLIAVSLIQLLFQGRTVQNKDIVIMMTFKEDLLPVIDGLVSHGYEVTVFTQQKNFKFLEHKDCVTYDMLSQRNLYRQLKALSTAKVIFIDTYYHLFGAFKKKPNQTIIQTWHAAGALKNFGLEDHALNKQSAKSIAQYQAVYDATDKYLVGCSQMAYCFKQSFGVREEQLLNFGIPRLTHYLKSDISEQQRRLKQQLDIKGKVAVYLPTYREAGEMNKVLNHQAFEQALPEFTLLCKYHPAVKAPSMIQQAALSTTELLMIADVIITDYSSLAIEASLIGKPAIFYVYDVQDYKCMRGLNQFFDEIPNDYKVYTEADLHQRIAQGKLVPLFEDWHTYNTQESVHQLMNYVNKLVKI